MSVNGIKLATELAMLGRCTASALSALTVPPLTSRKLTQQKLSAILANQQDFDTPTEATEIFGLVEVMKVLQESVVPSVPIAWADLRVKDALVQVYEQRKNELDPLHRRCWFVRLSVHYFFGGLRSDGSVIETMNFHNSDAVAFTSFELANETVKRLKLRDVAARTEHLTCERRQSTVTVSLGELGF